MLHPWGPVYWNIHIAYTNNSFIAFSITFSNANVINGQTSVLFTTKNANYPDFNNDIIVTIDDWGGWLAPIMSYYYPACTMSFRLIKLDNC